MGKSAQATLNSAQTRPRRRHTVGSHFPRYFALFVALGGCNAAEHGDAARLVVPESASVSARASSAPLVSAAAPDPSPTPPSQNPGAANAPSAAYPEPATDAGSAAHTGAPHYVIAAVGDSLTDPRSHGGGYLDYVKQRCPNVEIDNFGRGATMVTQMRRHFDDEIASSPKAYTHLIVFGGVNDLYSDLTAFRTPSKIEADLGYMYGVAKARGMKVVALTVAPWGGFKRYFNASRADATHTVNAWIREQPKAGKVDAVVDAFSLLSCGDPDVLCDRFFKPFKDGIHFGPGGHRLLGDALFRAAFSDCAP
jgi:lysophospholipase L1-like esterase